MTSVSGFSFFPGSCQLPLTFFLPLSQKMQILGRTPEVEVDASGCFDDLVVLGMIAIGDLVVLLDEILKDV